MKKVLIGALVPLFLATGAGAKIGGGDVTFRVHDAGNVVYSHDLHVGKIGLSCTKCHSLIYSRDANNSRDKTTMAGMQSGKSCGACHNGQTAFAVTKNCDRCHQGSGYAGT
jgi:c(7)-type cytochrome triheme protein